MTENTDKQFNLGRIYVKDASLEVPGAPAIFNGQWKPQIDVQLNTNVQTINEGTHEVSLKITITASQEEAVGYIVEVEQAAIFTTKGLAGEELQAALAIHGPNNLLPFARATIADLISRASFPPFMLQPVNFEALFRDHVAKLRTAESESKKEEVTKH
jgi:preprotein translocase subunit SecB